MMSKLVPKLRFKEFSGEWEEKKLGDCLDYLQPTKYLVSNTDYNDKYETPVLTAGKTFILGYTNETDGIFKDKLPVIIFDDFTTATKYVDFPFKAKSSAMKILLAKENIDIKFMYELMQTIKYEVGNHERHWISKFAFLDVLIPKDSKEQQKIASTLSSLDNLIEAYKQKVEALQKHKKGLMQQLFPSDGEKVPKLRFKGFSGEWEEKEIGDICNYIVDNRGKTPPVINKGIPLIEVNAMGSKKINYTNISKYVSEETFNNWFRNYLKNGDILFSTVGRTAMCSLYDDKIKAGIAQNIVGLRCANENFTFVFYLLTEKNNNLKFKYIEMVAVQPSIKISQMINIKFYLPKPPEQQKIADCLSSLDDLITAHSKKVEALKQHKKGLMQQIFVSKED